MSAVRLGVGTEVRIDNRIFAVRRGLDGGLLQLQAEDDGELIKLERSALASSIAAGHAEIPTVTPPIAAGYSPDLSALPEDEQNEVLRRLAYVKLVEKPEMAKTGKKLVAASIAIGAEKLGDERPPSVATVYNWLKAYRNASGDACALIPRKRRRGNRTPRVHPEVRALLDDLIKERILITARPRAPDVYPALVVEINRLNRLRPEHDQLPTPTLRTVYRVIDTIDEYTKLKGRYGKRIADRETRHVGEGAKSTRPLERVEIDHTKMDIVACHDGTGLPLGRPTLTMVIDHYSRMPLGFYLGFETPSTAAVMLALRSAIHPKDWVKKTYPNIGGEWPCYGVPEVLVTDNGAELHSRSLELACHQLGITIQHTPVKTPWAKGVIERFLGEITRSLLHSAPGKTFHKIEARADNDPVGEAMVPLGTLKELICKWIIEVHARRIHLGIDAIPIERWNDGIKEFPPRLFARHEDLDVLLSECREERVIHPKGILMEGLWYNSRALTELRVSAGTENITVGFKFDAMNLKSIHVLDPRYDRYFEVPAVERDYAEGMGLHQHKVVRKHHRDMLAEREDRISIAEAREDIHKMISDAAASSKRKKSNAKMGRFLEASGTLKGDPGPRTEPDEPTSSGILPPVSPPAVDSVDWFDDPDDGDEEFLVRDMNRVQGAGKG